MSLVATGITVGGVATAGAIVAGASAVGSMLMGGFGAQTEDEKAELERLAEQMKQEKLDLLAGQKDLTLSATQSQFAGGQRDVSMGTQVGMRNIQTGAATATSRAGLATSGTIEQQTKIQTGDLVAKYKSDMTKLVDTRSLSRTEADLSYRKGELSAEEAYQSTLTDIESQPTGFLEGMFG